jgi:hypothetical protein
VNLKSHIFPCVVYYTFHMYTEKQVTCISIFAILIRFNSHTLPPGNIWFGKEAMTKFSTNHRW